MMLNVPELILILVIILLTVGLGKLSTIGQAIAKLRVHFHKGLHAESIDITPRSDTDGRASSALMSAPHKPGHQVQPVDEAEIEEPLSDD